MKKWIMNTKIGKVNMLKRVGLIYLLIVLTGCVQKNFHFQPSDSNHGIWDVSALGFIDQDSSFDILKDAIAITGLEEVYDGEEGNRTFILPNDQAFKDFFRTNGYSNITSIPVPVLKNLLKYLVVKDHVIFTDSSLSKSNNPIPYETLNGQVMYLSHQTSFIGIINEGTAKSFEILTSNIQSTNGVIHVVSSMVYFSLPQGTLQVDPNGGGTPLTLKKNVKAVTEPEGSVAIDSSLLLVEGASPENIIYTVMAEPEQGWLLMNGLNTLKEGDRFTQNDVNQKNIVFVDSGSGSHDQITLSAISTKGSTLSPFSFNIQAD